MNIMSADRILTFLGNRNSPAYWDVKESGLSEFHIDDGNIYGMYATGWGLVWWPGK
jgi:hypothetical protein